jgi:alpha-tubulin suppressor-like RCC1 family protein
VNVPTRPLVLLFSGLLPYACLERGDVLIAASVVAGAAGLAGAGGATAGGGSGGDSGSAGDAQATRASEVNIAEDHACAIVAGSAHCWGNNEHGQLGLGDHDTRVAPALIISDRVWRHLTLGRFQTCGLDDVGGVFCWGENARGGLGVGDRNERTTPAAVTLPNLAISLSGDFQHTCAVLLDNRLFCWGNNEEGQLGQDDEYPGSGSTDADALTPIRVPGPDFQSVDTGQGHTCAIALDGALYCWGRNSFSELGAGASAIQIRTPTRVGSDSDWLEVVAGQGHTCARKRDLSIWCWGMNTGASDDGGYPLGIEGAGVVSVPQRVGAASDWTRIRSNTFHGCGVKQNSELWCWGRNAEGQLGLGDTENRPTPVLIGLGYADVNTGRFTTCALTTDGGVRCAGKNENGELGLGDRVRRSSFTDVSFDAP